LAFRDLRKGSSDSGLTEPGGIADWGTPGRWHSDYTLERTDTQRMIAARLRRARSKQTNRAQKSEWDARAEVRMYEVDQKYADKSWRSLRRSAKHQLNNDLGIDGDAKTFCSSLRNAD
jgi:hypothetical protein